MPTTDTLAALARAWLDDDDCGPVLADALEEANWPLRWEWRGINAQLFIGDVPVAEVWRRTVSPGWGGVGRRRPEPDRHRLLCDRR